MKNIKDYQTIKQLDTNS